MYPTAFGDNVKKVYIAKQKIFTDKGKVYAHELLYRDHKDGIQEFKSNIQATSHVLLNALSNIDMDTLLGKDGLAFVNLDEYTLTSGIIDILDTKRFILEILETTELTERVISKVVQYHKRGFKIAIDDFDCTAEMIQKFTPILKYVHFIKMDVITAEPENLKNVVAKIKHFNIQLLAEKVETKEDYDYYMKMGFDLFQGYYLSKPEIIEVDRSKDLTRLTIMQLIKLIKNNGSTSQIEYYIKQRTDLSYKLIKFLNSQEHFDTEIESIIQIITLLGRDRLLRWLLLYLYSEMSHNPVSKAIMDIAKNRAEKMEASVKKEEKDKAYIAGMFSMLDALFEMDIKDLLKDINMDKDITDLLVSKRGKFLAGFREAELSERQYLKQLFIQNFDSINILDIIYALEFNNIHINKDKL